MNKQKLITMFILSMVFNVLAQEQILPGQDNTRQRFMEKNIFQSVKKPQDLYNNYPFKNIPVNDLHNYNSIFKTQFPNVPLSSTGVEKDWVRTYESNLLPGYDVAVDVAIDGQDNIYVTGYTTNYPNGVDLCTIKYDNNGNQLWAVYYNGDANGDDVASAIAIDDSGNVYVGGIGSMAGTGYDFIILKYDSEGQLQWESRYDSPAHGNDKLVALTLDHSGYLYATGSSITESGLQLATMKINSVGVNQWVAYYSGPGNCDGGRAIAVDPNGNVYVAGESKGQNYDKDYVTIKYNPDGTQQWATRYHYSGYSQEYVEAIAVDDSGNVYVTGSSGSDYATIKYDKDGEMLWIARYDGVDDEYDFDRAFDVTLDKQGNVYVTGANRLGSFGYDDNFATIKYNSDGVKQWVAEYDGGADATDVARSVFVDDSNNVYVSGYSELCEDCLPDFVTIKYNAQGQQMWLARYDGGGNSDDYPPAMAMNSAGELIVTGASSGVGSDIDYATVKYDANGQQLWDSRFNGKNRERGYVNDLKIDDWENIYVTGESCNEFVAIKYNALGETDWIARLNGKQYGYGAAKFMTLDDQGNVYVTGEIRLSLADDNYDIVIVKYSAEGVQQWVTRYDSPPDQWGRYEQDFVDDIEVDRSGNVYVTGHSPGEGSGYDFVTIKYSSNGVQQWIKRYTSGDDNSDEPIDILLDDQGGVYVCGNNGGAEPSFTLIKYNSSGEQQWIKVHQEIDTRAFAAAQDGWGNIYIVGSDGDYWENMELIILKYSPNGDRQWITRYKHSDFLIRGGNIRLDELGNVFVTATLFQWEPSIVWNFVALKFNAEGEKIWESPLKSEYNYLIDQSIALDRENNLYIACYTGNNFFIIKYDPQGMEKWTLNYPNARNLWQLCKAMEIDNNGNIYVASDTRGSHWSVFNTIKFTQTGDDSLTPVVISGYQLSHNFPNPFKKQTLIYYRLPQSSEVSIKIYNFLGQKIVDENLGIQPRGEHPYYFRADNLSSGIYFYQFKAGDFVKTRKMVVVQ